MPDFAVLKRQHAEILTIARDLDRLLASSTPEERLPAVGLVRMRLARLIQEHLVTENEVLYQPLQQRGLTSSVPDFAFFIEEIKVARMSY